MNERSNTKAVAPARGRRNRKGRPRKNPDDLRLSGIRFDSPEEIAAIEDYASRTKRDRGAAIAYLALTNPKLRYRTGENDEQDPAP